METEGGREGGGGGGREVKIWRANLYDIFTQVYYIRSLWILYD